MVGFEVELLPHVEFKVFEGDDFRVGSGNMNFVGGVLGEVGFIIEVGATDVLPLVGESDKEAFFGEEINEGFVLILQIDFL